MIIGCMECTSQDCRGCNIYELYKALLQGVFDPVMDANRHIDQDALRDRMSTNMKEECNHCIYKMEADDDE